LNLKKCDRTKIEGFKFWKNWLKLILKELSHKFFNVRIVLEVLSKKEEQDWKFSQKGRTGQHWLTPSVGGSRK
jgi:hypothetical protein